MQSDSRWTRQQLLVALNLYTQIPFGKLHKLNKQIIEAAARIGRTSSALAMKLVNFASLDPAITSTGRRGLKGASKADRALWAEMNEDWEQFVIESNDAMISLGLESESELSSSRVGVDRFSDFTGKNKTTLGKVRIGQGFFRRAVLSAYDYKCCITGLARPELLVASHIIPWRDDASARLNPRNGLALSALHDRAFDLGIITILEDFRVCVASDFSQ